MTEKPGVNRVYVRVDHRQNLLARCINALQVRPQFGFAVFLRIVQP